MKKMKIRQWAVEQAVKLAAIPQGPARQIQNNTAMVNPGQIAAQAQEIYDWVTQAYSRY